MPLNCTLGPLRTFPASAVLPSIWEPSELKQQTTLPAKDGGALEGREKVRH